MKGGKGGRKRRSPGTPAKRPGSPRGAPNPSSPKRQWSDAPKKGSKPKPFGGTRSTGEVD